MLGFCGFLSPTLQTDVNMEQTVVNQCSIILGRKTVTTVVAETTAVCMGMTEDSVDYSQKKLSETKRNQ